jgi:hypothetical protein
MAKEFHFYENEVVENEAKLVKLKEGDFLRDPNSKADTYDIKNFENVLAESYMMVPDSKGRLVKTVEDLRLFVDINQGDETVSGSEWFAIAKEVLATEGGADEKEEVTRTEVEGLGEDEAF